MRRLFAVGLGVGLGLACGCGHGKAGPAESIAVTEKPVVAKPLEVVGESPARAADVAPFELAIGAGELCVRLEGKVHCGRGDDTEPLASAPPIGGIDDATSLALGTEFGCVTTRRGAVRCWGLNASAQLGAMIATERSNDPVEVVGVTNAKRVYAGDAHACATTNDGKLWCWGLNLSGETGGSTSWAPEARQLARASEVGVRDVVRVAMGSRSTCAITKGGEVYCWGQSIGEEQQRAHGDTNEKPTAVTALKGMEDLGAAGGVFCGVRGGDVYCAGDAYGIVPNDPDRHRDEAAKVALGGIRKVRIGGSHACALARDGRVHCWGYGGNGELGRGEPYDPNAGVHVKGPEPVAGIDNARDIVVSRASSCAITGPEEVFCWGLWAHGPRGAPRQHRSPVRVRVR